MALVKFPNINAPSAATHDHARPDRHQHRGRTEGGADRPVVRGVDKKSIGAVARDTNDLVSRARDGKLQPDEYSGGTFTVSNLGPYGIETFIAIVTRRRPPRWLSALRQKAVVVDGQIVIRDRMNITVSADHRVTDGAEAAQFVGEVRRLLENPLALLM